MVAPGWVPTESWTTPKKIRMDTLRRFYGPMGQADDVGWAVTYFASDEASFVTGQTIAVNGGKTVW